MRHSQIVQVFKGGGVSAFPWGLVFALFMEGFPGAVAAVTFISLRAGGVPDPLSE